MLLKLRTFLKSYRAAGGASLLVVLVLLLCTSMLSLTSLFSGSSNLSDMLISSIPLEFAFERTHYFESYYSLEEGDFAKKSALEIRLPFLASREKPEDEDLFPHHHTNIAKEEQLLEHFLSGLDKLAQDPAVKYASYNLHYALGIKNCATEGYEPGYYVQEGSATRLGTLHVYGISGFDFFAHNHISFVEVEEDSFSDNAAYISDQIRIRGEDGQMRPVQIGDRIDLESLGGWEQYGTFTVKGIYRSFRKFDYSYGADGSYLGTGAAMYLPNAALRQIHPMENTYVNVQFALPYVHTIVFDIKSIQDYDSFYEKLDSFVQEMEVYANELRGLPMKLEIQTPPYLKMAGTVGQTVHYYSLVMWIIDAMLLILSGGLIWYLLLGKRHEMFLLYSLGMSKLRISGRYLAYFLLPVLLTVLIGIAPGLLLNRILCTRIANQIFSMENELLRFSSSGNQILTAARESIQSFAVTGKDIVQALGFTILAAAAVTGIIVFIGTLVQLNGNLRANVRGKES